MMHMISYSEAGCRMSIGAVTRGLGWRAAASPLSSVPMDALMATILLIQNALKPVDWLPWQGHGLLPAKGSVNNIEEFLIVIFVFTDQVGVVVSFGLSDQIVYVATTLHEDVAMDG